ncbi:MAG: hypothetical protein U0792_14720 [Gemmataceae bacterium]
MTRLCWGKDAVAQRRIEEGECQEREDGSGILIRGEATRVAIGSHAPHVAHKNPDENVSLFWRVFGGTILSMVALGALTLYNSISSNIAELRAELSREREARAELVKKDEFNTRTTSQYERIRALDALKADLEAFKERVNANVAAVDSLKKDTATSLEAVKKDTAATSDAVKKDMATIDVLKEKSLATSSDLKSIRDEIGKLQQEVDRNRANDLERKASRDLQARQLDETLKELQKGLQDCREKLARLEGLRGVGTPGEGPAVPPRPVLPAETKGPGDTGTGAGSAKPNPEKAAGGL